MSRPVYHILGIRAKAAGFIVGLGGAAPFYSAALAVVLAERDRWALWLPVGRVVGLYFVLPSEPAPWVGAGVIAIALDVSRA